MKFSNINELIEFVKTASFQEVDDMLKAYDFEFEEVPTYDAAKNEMYVLNSKDVSFKTSYLLYLSKNA